jgi:cation diffusion facilitator family transporter
MHSHSIEPLRHDHTFLGRKHNQFERRTWIVVAITLVTMVAEIAAGVMFGSMALAADGLHMATHAGALGLAALAYSLARKHANDARFSFGTGKVGELAAFASAIILALVALLIAYESVMRLVTPVTIRFNEAIAVALLGLLVNLASAWLLYDHDQGGHAHAHPDDHVHTHDHSHHADSNARTAYVHVLTDALTSVLAIAALVGGSVLGWTWIDPVAGLLGTVIILVWAWGLLRSSGAVLLDIVPDLERTALIRTRLERDGDLVSDLHVWRLGPGHLGVTATIIADVPQPPDHYKARLAGVDGLSHVTIEVQPCPGMHEARQRPAL